MMIIRLKVFIPVVLIIALISFVILYRIDVWLKDGIESGISSMTGTKTDIDGLQLSFKDSFLKIDRLQIASAKNEFQNLLEFESIIFDFEFLPLLERRVVVEDFSIKGVDWGTERESSGFLPKRKRKSKPSWMSPYIDQAFDQIQEEYKAMPVTKLTDFEIPNSPRDILRQIDLESEEALKDAIASIQSSQSEWTAKASSLRSLSEYKKYWNEFKSITSNLPDDIPELRNRIKSVNSILAFYKSEKEQVDQILGSVQSEYKGLQQLYDSALESVQNDINRAKSLVSVDQLNLKNLSSLIFGPHWVERFERALQYHHLLREKLSALTEEGETEKVEVKQRAQGRDILFVTKIEKPGFVLENSEFDVKGLQKEEAGRLSQTYSLMLRDINSSPSIYGKPSELKAEALFREAGLASSQLEMFWDYTQETPQDRYELKAQKILAKNWPVGIPKVFEVHMTEGYADAKSKLEYLGKEMKWVTRADFSKVSWKLPDIDRLGFLIRALYDVLNRVNSFYVEFELRRAAPTVELDNPKLQYKVRSDLDSRMNAAIQALIREQLDKFKKKLEKAIQLQVEKYKNEIVHLINKYKNELMSVVEEKKRQVDDYIEAAEDKVKELEARIKKVAEDKARAAADKAKEKAQPAVNKLKKGVSDKIKKPF